MSNRKIIPPILATAQGVRPFQKLVALVLASLMVVTNVPFFLASTYAAADAENSPSVQELLKKIHPATDPKNLRANFDLLEKLHAATPRPAFDIGAKADELGNNVDKIFAFVRDQVRYEVYQGVLRGPRGTLLAMAGNACDKTSLLAELLRHHKIEVRFAEGSLSGERAEGLVNQMFSSLKNRETYKPSIAIPEQFLAAAEAADDLIMGRFESNVKELLAALKNAEVRIASEPQTTPKLLVNEAASRHLWLEYREGDKWIALDPSFSEVKVGQAFANAAATSASIPASLFHKIGVRVTLEERIDGEIKARDVLHYESTAAELGATDVSLSFDTSATQSEWSATPVLRVDGKQVMGEGFSGPVGGLGGSAAELGKRLFAAPGKLPKQNSNDLTAIWLDVDFLAPSGAKETVRHEILDRLGPAARSAKMDLTTPLSPLAGTTGVPAVFNGQFAARFSCGRSNPAGALDRDGKYLEELKAIYTSQITDTPAEKERSEEEAARLKVGCASALQVMATNFQLLSGVYLEVARHWYEGDKFALYEATPRLMIVGLNWTTGKPVLSLDLLRNELRLVATESVGNSIAWLSIFRGIMDAALEQFVMGDLMPPAGKQDLQTSATDIFERARSKGIPLSVLRTADDIKKLSLPENTAARLVAMLGDNVLITAPAKPVSIASKPRIAWWRINLQTGDTVSVLDTGLHGTAGEYSLTALMDHLNRLLFIELYIGTAVSITLFFIMCITIHARDHHNPVGANEPGKNETPGRNP